MSNRYERAISEINRRSASSPGFIADPFLNDTDPGRGLVRTRTLLDELQSPDERLRIVHVAGSKGKGSAATFVANMLTDAGLRTGLSTSPHLHSFRERMTVDGQAITREKFGQTAQQVLEAATRVERTRPELGQVSAFETLIAMSLSYFVDVGCSFAVVEVGLGGRFDTTNAIVPEVAVITALELEHTDILGHSLQEIAWNKGGIIKPGVPVVASQQEPEALLELENIATSQGARLMLGGRDWHWHGTRTEFTFTNTQATIERLSITMPGVHQRENAGTAVAAVLQLCGKGMPPGPAAIRSGLRRAELPGRFEIVELQGRTIVLDGAHTPTSARLLAAALEESDIVDPVVIAGFLKDKDIAALVETLASFTSRLLLTPVANPRTATFEHLSTIAHQVAGETAMVFPAIEEAWTAALTTAPPHCPVVITGSLTVVARVRELLCLPGAG